MSLETEEPRLRSSRSMPASYLRSLNPRLPLPVWLLQIGGLTNSFGNGLALPFLVIYLHDVRGFSLGTAGLIVAISSAGQVAAGIFAGPLIDRFGPKRVLGTGLVLQAVGYGLLPLVRSPWQAFVLVALEGAGSAGFWPSQSTLISRLTPAARRHAAFAQQRVTMNLGIGLGGLAAGSIARVHDPTTFTVLFVLDALTFLAYVGVLAFIRDPGVEPGEAGDAPASYRAVLRHKTFLGLWALNFLFVFAGYSLFNLLPVVRARRVRPQRAPDRRDLLPEHRHDRRRATAAVALDRGPAANAGARLDAAPLGRRLAARGWSGILADGAAPRSP